MPPPTNADIRAAVREEIHDLLFRLGYDLHDPADMRKLADDLEWASKKREREAKSAASLAGAVWLFVTAVVGSLATVFGQWLVAKMSTAK